jgi:hypothetical protein
MRSLFFSMTFLLIISGCSDCQDCQPFTDEPYINLRFLNIADSSHKIVIVDSINHVSASSSKYFQDTTSLFRLPLNMNLDVSDVALVFRDTTDIDTPLTGDLSIAYEREFFKRDDNYIIVKCFINTVESSFEYFELYCRDSINNTCESNDLTARIYF